jgi:hypothetical protein
MNMTSHHVVRPDLFQFLFLFLLAACQFNPGGRPKPPGEPTVPPIAGLTSLTVEPAVATLTVASGGPAQTQQFRAFGVVNGSRVDVTKRVTWSSERGTVALINSSGLATTVTGNGGETRIRAVNGSHVGEAQLTVRYSFTGPDPGATGGMPLPDDPAGKLAGRVDPGRAPQLVYPNNGVLLPPNVSGIEVHFRPGAGNTLFEVGFVGPLGEVKLFIRCTRPQDVSEGCVYQPDPDLWRGVAETNAGKGLVKLTVRGTDDSGSGVGSSATFDLEFSKDPLRGALYYWTTSDNTGVMRWNFADATQTTAQRVISPAQTGGTCVGCHSISPDGARIVASVGGQNDARVLLFDVPTAAAAATFPLAERSQFETWKFDSSAFIGVGRAGAYSGANQLRLFDGQTGQMTQAISLGDVRADHPDWGWKTGNVLAFTSVDLAGSYTDQRPGIGGISYLSHQNGTFGAPQVLVPPQPGKNRYYPAVSPSENLLVFNESTCNSGSYSAECDGDTDPTASMYGVRIAAGAAPVALAMANAPGIEDGGNTILTNSYPKWSPFEFQLTEFQSLLWLTVSSSRQYGLRNPPQNNRGETVTLIWMVGVDPSALTLNQDPSYAAFCLPFQDIRTSNHIAQWTKAVPGRVD